MFNKVISFYVFYILTRYTVVSKYALAYACYIQYVLIWLKHLRVRVKIIRWKIWSLAHFRTHTADGIFINNTSDHVHTAYSSCWDQLVHLASPPHPYFIQLFLILSNPHTAEIKMSQKVHRIEYVQTKNVI